MILLWIAKACHIDLLSRPIDKFEVKAEYPERHRQQHNFLKMNPPPPTKPSTGFMDLPAELRLQVYEEWMRIDPPMIVAGGILEHTLLSLSPRPAPVGCPLFKILFYTVPLIVMPEGRHEDERLPNPLFFQLHDQVCGEEGRHRIRLCFVDLWPVPGGSVGRKEYVKRHLLEGAQHCRVLDVYARRHMGPLSNGVPEENSEMYFFYQSMSELKLMLRRPNKWQLIDYMVIIGVPIMGSSLGLFCTKLVLASIPDIGHDAVTVAAGVFLCAMFVLLGLL